MADPVARPASWLRDNWRPVSALLLAALPVAHAAGFAPGLTEEAMQRALETAGWFLSVYAAGRTAEKVTENLSVARAVASAVIPASFEAR